MNRSSVLFTFLAIWTAFVTCLLVIPERAKVEYVNPKYLQDANLTVVRYGRRSKYYINVFGKNLHPWGNNVTLDCVFYEFLHNEYRRSFVEFHFKICDMINKDPYMGKIFKDTNITCPVPSGYYEFYNLTAPTENFPMVWPFKKARMNIELLVSSESIARGHIYLQFVEQRKKSFKGSV